MNFARIAARIAASTYDFHTKMAINAVVLHELSRTTGMDENSVAIAILESDIHEIIRTLAEAVMLESKRITSIDQLT